MSFMNEKREYECIVVGLGGVGSGSLYWLSKRNGSGVLGLEQFQLGHNNGGSQDVSRMVRNSYHSLDYSGLTKHTFSSWNELEKESGIQLCFKTGGVFFWTRPSEQATKMLKAYADALTVIGASYELLNGKEMRERWPQFTVADDAQAIYEHDAGIVDAANANALHIQLARLHGAQIIENCLVEKLEKTPDGIKVSTTQGLFRCKKLLVCAGAWTNNILQSTSFQLPITVTQEQTTYMATPYIKQFTKERFPLFFGSESGINFYAFPAYCNTFFKVGIDASGPAVTAQSRSFVADTVREDKCKTFLQRNLPQAVGPIAYTKTCLYAMTPDRNFVIDSLASQGWPDVIVCVGAGHIYKFASLIGRILSELAVDGKTQYDIAAFTVQRKALTDPTFKPVWKLAKL